MMKHDEAINLYGNKVKVKYVGFHDTRNYVKGDYYLLYDEAEVYHIENSKTKKIVRAFPANSYASAFQTAIMIIDQIETQNYKRSPLLDLRYNLNVLMNKISDVENEFLPHSEKREVIEKLWEVFNILEFNEKEYIKSKQQGDKQNETT